MAAAGAPDVTPKRFSDSFSMSAILSEETPGRKRRRTLPDRLGGKQPRRDAPLSLFQAGSLIRSEQLSPPDATGQPPLNSTLTTSPFASPFNTSLLSALGHDPVRQDVFGDSLGMLSTVALYHSELSELSTSNSSSCSMQDKLADMRLSSGTSDTSSQELANSCESPSAQPATCSTPHILKRDKQRRRRRASSSHTVCSPTSSQVPRLSAFSPSIFLSRPTVSRDCSSFSLTSSPSNSGSKCVFVTSTPIKRNKENVVCRPTESGPDRHLLCRRSQSRVRTKLSPLLENACSPIARREHCPVATSLLLSQSASTSLPAEQAPPMAVPFQFLLPPPPPLDSYRLPFCLPPSHLPSTLSPVTTAQWGGTRLIKSVPPWFIFSSQKSEGKRSRLTEAINRSLSETPAQNPKLPAEWSKYALGQTEDQRQLTESARMFLQCRPRQLTFEDMDSCTAQH